MMEYKALSFFIYIVLYLQPLNYVMGQCNGTEPLLLTATSSPQYFTSPNYPSSYPINADCSWRVQAPGGYDKIIINIEDFDSESTTTDYMDLYDGYNSSSTLVVRMAVTNRKTVNAFVSSGDVLYFTFVSDYSIQYSGFQILYFSNDTAKQPACDGELSVTSSEQVLMSPNLPHVYNQFHACSWTFTSTTGILFQIKFLDMGSCGQNHLRFYDGNSTNDNQLETECSTALIYEFTDVETTGFTGHVAWTVTNQSSDYYGFMLVYRTNVVTTTSTTVATTTLAPGVLDSCVATGAYFTAAISPNFDYLDSPAGNGGNYPSNTLCRWYFSAPENYSVEAYFDDQTTYAIESSTYCSYDYVSFYDGNSTSDTLLNTVCGSNRPTSIYRSAGTQMLIIFSSDYSLEYAGFRLRVSAVDNSYPTCKSGFTSYTATATPQTFSNANSPYNSNEDEYFLVENPAGLDLILQLTAMNLERASGCIYDRITIHDGACLKDTVLDIHCGQFLKRWELTGTEYLVHFHSDSSVQKDGFTMQYSLGTASTGAPTTTTTTAGPHVSVEIGLINQVLTNYSSENFPVRNLSSAIEANIEVYLAGINSLDEVQQKLTTTIQFEINWTDDNMQWPPSKLMGIRKILIPQNDLWRPDLALLNSFTKITAMGNKFMFIVVESSGKCAWKPYQILESTCKADMTNYPYDTQECDLKFSTWASSSDQVQTIIGSAGMTKHVSFVENSEWHLQQISQKNETINGQLTAVFTLKLKRNHSFIVFYVTIPVVLLSLLNTLTFALPAQGGEKSGYAITVFLSFLIYIIVTFQKLPDNSDSLSLFAMYVLVMTGISNLTVIISVLEIRMLELKTIHKPMLQCTISFTKWILRLQHRLLCVRKESEEAKQNVIHRIRTEDDDDDEDEEEDNTWPEFVSALDFVCFWVFLMATISLAIGCIVYLELQ